MQNQKISSRIIFFFFLKSSQCNKNKVFKTLSNHYQNKKCTNLEYRVCFWLRKHPCFCSLSWTDLLEQPRYRTAQITLSPKKKKKAHHRARQSKKEKWTLSMPFLLFSFLLSALSSLLFWQEYVMLFFIFFFFLLAQKACYSANALNW